MLIAVTRDPARHLLVTMALVLSAGLPAVADEQSKPADPAVAEYQRKLAAYTVVREPYEAAAKVYWDTVTKKRRIRIGKHRNNAKVTADDYVLTQPPVYSGPPKPVDPTAPPEEPEPEKVIPVVADFLKAAKAHFNFVPQRPRREIDFKRAYARSASAAGLTKNQIVRIFGFEASGNGAYDVQAGLEYRKGAKAISTALGYNQLLTTNTISILAVHGGRIVKALRRKAARARGAAKVRLKRKIAAVQRMIAFSRTVPVRWSAHETLAKTPEGLGPHALNLDIDVGPLLQTQKLVDSIVFAKRKGFARPLTAAELELMNLTGDGNGYDMVTMPPELRKQVPTANFFRQGGYERNTIASRHNTVAKLLGAIDAKMDRETKRQGARDLAASFPR